MPNKAGLRVPPVAHHARALIGGRRFYRGAALCRNRLATFVIRRTHGSRAPERGRGWPVGFADLIICVALRPSARRSDARSRPARPGRGPTRRTQGMPKPPPGRAHLPRARPAALARATPGAHRSLDRTVLYRDDAMTTRPRFALTFRRMPGGCRGRLRRWIDS